MPQMAPLWWLMMLMTFIITLIIMCIKMHYQNNKKTHMTNVNPPYKKMINWKW